MNIKSISRKVEILSKTTKFLLDEAKKSEVKYNKDFDELSSRFTKDSKFRLSTFQKIYDDLKKASDAADLEKTVYGYLAMLQEVENNIITKYNAEKTFDKVFYTKFFRQFTKIESLLLQDVKLEPVDPSFDSDDDVIDRTYNKIFGTNAKFPTTAQERGRKSPSVDSKGKKIPGIGREESNENYLKALKLATARIGADLVMSDPHEEELNAALRTHSDNGDLAIEQAATKSERLVDGIIKDLSKLDPASSEVESASDDVKKMLTGDKLSELEAAMKKIEDASREGLHIPHPDYDPDNPNSPGYDEVENAQYVDMTMVNRLTNAERLVIRSKEIRAREIANKKARDAYRNRSPEQILADQVKRQKAKEEKEKEILSQIELKDMTPSEIVKLLEREYGGEIATEKQTFDKIAMISLALKTADSAEDKKTLKSAVATIRQRLQKDFAKTKFLQHDGDELADLTEFLVEVYMKVLDAVFSNSAEEFKDEEFIYDSEEFDDLVTKSDIEDIKEKITPESISAYYSYNDMANKIAKDISELDEMDIDDQIELNSKIEKLNQLKGQSDTVRGVLEDFNGLRQLVTSSTYDFYAKKVWARAEKELASAIATYAAANNLPKEIMTSKSISDKIIYYAMGRTYFGELEGHPMAERPTEKIEQFAYDLIGHRLGSRKGASIPKVAQKTRGLGDFNLDVDQAVALAEDCISSGGTIGSVIHKIFAPDYAEAGLLEEVKAFYRGKGPSYLFGKIYEGMLYGSFYRKNPMGIEIPEKFKEKWMVKARAFYKLINDESDPKNKLDTYLKKMLEG